VTPSISAGYWNPRKNTERCALVGFEFQQLPVVILVVEFGVDVGDVLLVEMQEDLAASDLVRRMAGDDLRERRLPRAVRTHQCVDVPGLDG